MAIKKPDGDAIVRALLSGGDLSSLGLPLEGQRWVIEGLRLPKPVGGRKVEIAGKAYLVGKENPNGEDFFWQSITFRRCDLSNLKAFNVQIAKCNFEQCKMKSVGLWSTTLRECNFLDCDLRNFAFGGIDDASLDPNHFEHTCFVNCDMRDTAHTIEHYLFCRFDRCNFKSVDFNGAVFVDCVFIGVLDDVTFRDRCPSYPTAQENKLARCDFRAADVSEVFFQRIDLDPSLFPSGPDTIVLPRGPADWSQWKSSFDPVRDKGKIWYIENVGPAVGSPTITSRKGLGQIFSLEEINELVEIAKG